jgi:hypothetical protein
MVRLPTQKNSKIDQLPAIPLAAHRNLAAILCNQGTGGVKAFWPHAYA